MRRSAFWPLLALAIPLGMAGLASAAAAQSILLRVHPRVGDTLHTRLEQRTEVNATMRGQTGPSLKSVTTALTLDSRTIVQTSLPGSTVVLTIVDSAAFQTTDAHADSQVAQAQRSLRGQQLQLRLASDGSVESAQDIRGGGVSRDLTDAMAAMPAVFPRRPVNVGEQWTREMPLPAGGPLGARGSAHVSAVFRLDSLDRTGNFAFVSMHGDVVPDSSAGVQVSGTMSGSMQVDRARGWMIDSRVLVLVRSTFTPSAGSALAPMRLVTRVTQRLRTMDKR